MSRYTAVLFTLLKLCLFHPCDVRSVALVVGNFKESYKRKSPAAVAAGRSC